MHKYMGKTYLARVWAFLEHVCRIGAARAVSSPPRAVVLLVEAHVGARAARDWAKDVHIRVLCALTCPRPFWTHRILVIAARLADTTSDRAALGHKVEVGIALAGRTPLWAGLIAVAAVVYTDGA